MTKQISNGVNKTIIGISIAVLVLAGVVWIARPGLEDANTASLSPAPGGGALTAEENAFDFGPISMATGNVKHEFKIKNTGTGTIIVEKMYTSCMCTTASLVTSKKKYGPYGMPGHGFVPKINTSIGPNEEVTVETIFDPAAHGPAGVGRVERAVILENNAGEPLELLFTALVTP